MTFKLFLFSFCLMLLVLPGFLPSSAPPIFQFSKVLLKMSFRQWQKMQLKALRGCNISAQVEFFTGKVTSPKIGFLNKENIIVIVYWYAAILKQVGGGGSIDSMCQTFWKCTLRICTRFYAKLLLWMKLFLIQDFI